MTTILHNPFTAGLIRQHLNITAQKFGTEGELSKNQETAYWAGRTVNYLSAIAGLAADGLLQLIQSLFVTLELTVVKVEGLILDIQLPYTLTYQVHQSLSPSAFIKFFRSHATQWATNQVLNDLSSTQAIDALAFARNYEHFLVENL